MPILTEDDRNLLAKLVVKRAAALFDLQIEKALNEYHTHEWNNDDYENIFDKAENLVDKIEEFLANA